MSKPPATNSRRRYSSNSGLDGGLPARMSSSGSIKPTPSRYPQRRLTKLMAKYRLSSETSQSANCSRRVWSEAGGALAGNGKAGATTSLVRTCVTSPVA